MIFNIVFFISLTSVLIQGTSLGIVAKWFKVALPEEEKPLSVMDVFLSDRLKSSLREMKIGADSPAIGKRIVDLNFPKTAIIAMINRNKQFLTPNGATVLEANDVLIVLSENPTEAAKVTDCLGG